MPVKPIPEGFHTITPYVVARDATKVIEFLKRAFGATLAYPPVNRPDGKIMHADLLIGDSHVMIADENDYAKATPVSLYVYVPDVDAVFRKSVDAGGEIVMEPADMFYGDRSGTVKDSSGNSWNIATHKEDIEPAELTKRAQDFMKQHKPQAA